ncbi:M64 family metallopeptidase [Sphingomonas jaspsi]|uniref:M64 family metallopeptidase n=1 Tax=Sphingomonas jaspsi TaxID=392409 RepID=UPI0004BAC06A|nr:M64 family metallopeptidase [Sphingomonas jaspsi]
MARKPRPASDSHFIEAFPLVDGAPVPVWTEVMRPKPDDQLFGMLPAGALPLHPSQPTGPAVLRSVRHPPTPGATFLFVSEGFGDDRDRFFNRAEKVAAGLLSIEPFKSLAAIIAIDALFIPLAGGAVVDIGCNRSQANQELLKPTLFATQCCIDGSTNQLWCGDEDPVRSVVAKALTANGRAIGQYQFLAVLIDSAKYGGAGSIPNSVAKPRIAWATTDHAQSLLILLHELGHAFGLQDEYESPYVDPIKPWRNISRYKRPDQTPWRQIVTAPDKAALTCPAGTKWTGSRAVVGTFEGAGYRPTDRFRPTVDCKMRTLAAEFCPVCADQIRASIDPAFVPRITPEV